VSAVTEGKPAGPRRRGLGMGLAALLDAPASAEEALRGGQARRLPIERLSPSTLQPRRDFPEAELEALAESIRRHGVLQPLLVRPRRGTDGFEIVAGERRWRAAQRASLHEVPALVRDLDDQDVIEMALVENLQRQDLNALEEADAYRRLIEEFGYTQDAVAKLVGKSRPHVANTLRLLGLPDELRAHVVAGTLSAGHARALLGVGDAATLAARVVAQDLSVRATEALVAAATRPPAGRAAPLGRDPDLADLERRLAQRLGLAVTLRPGRRGGALVVRYSTADQLEALLARLDFGG
jgi:ParB family chromosome partitioning protein